MIYPHTQTLDTSLRVSAGVNRNMTDITRTRFGWKDTERSVRGENTGSQTDTHPHLLMLKELQNDIAQILQIDLLFIIAAFGIVHSTVPPSIREDGLSR